MFLTLYQVSDVWFAQSNSIQEKQQKRAEEEKNAPPPATATEAVRRMLDKKVKMSLLLIPLD